MIRSRITRYLAVCAIVGGGGVGTASPAATASPPPAPNSSPAPPALGAAIQSAESLVKSRPADLRAGADDGFVRHKAISSAGVRYVPYDRTYRNLPVIGGDFVVVVNAAGQADVPSVAQKSVIRGLGTTPKLTRASAEKIASSQLKSVSDVEESRLVVYALDGPPRLAWESTVNGVGADGRSRLTVQVDAITGAVLDRRDHVQRDVGHGALNGPNPLTIPTAHFSFIDHTQVLKTKWVMWDQTQGGMNCNATTIFKIDPVGVPVWGNGDPKNLETACVDAMFGAKTQVNMLSQWLGRDGMNGDGGGFPMTVGLQEKNAYYIHTPISEGIHIGYDNDGNWLADLDVVGHENGHGIDNHTPGGTSNNGTSEFVADTFGAATEWFANEPAPYDTPDYVIGDRTNLLKRRMFTSVCYSASTPTMEVHAAAAPGDHWFYLVAEGSNPTNGQPPSPTCNGATVTGLGIQKAIQIMYNAMLMKNSNSSYLAYRTWTLTAAKNLTPNDCGAFNTVKAAWDGVSVPAQPGDPVCYPPITVPNVVGGTRASATTAIQAAGLVLGSVIQDHGCSDRAGTVLDQNPSAGPQAIPPNSAVNITVASSTDTRGKPCIIK